MWLKACYFSVQRFKKECKVRQCLFLKTDVKTDFPVTQCYNCTSVALKPLFSFEYEPDERRR